MFTTPPGVGRTHVERATRPFPIVDLLEKAKSHVKQDYEKLQNIAIHQYNIGVEYYNNKEYNKAVRSFLLASDKGFYPALIAISKCYKSGKGLTKNEEKSKHYKSLALQRKRLHRSSIRYWEIQAYGKISTLVSNSSKIPNIDLQTLGQMKNIQEDFKRLIYRKSS